MAKTRRAGRIFQGFAFLAKLGVLGIAVVLSVLWRDCHRATSLPRPTGPFAVGRATFAWSDPERTDPMAPRAGSPRELFAWIWFPAAPRRPGQSVEDYWPAPWREAFENRPGAWLLRWLWRDLAGVQAHSLRDAEVAPEARAYPVVLMRAGLAAQTASYTTLAEDLASHGYMVVGFDAPYRSTIVVFPDGRVIARAPQNDADLVSGSQKEQLAGKLMEAWSADMGFALDQLARLNASDPSGRFRGRLDLERVGVFGHSLGGATALQFCHDDPRCKAGIDVDGAPLGRVIAEGVAQPFLFLLSDHSREPDAETRPVLANLRALYDRLPPDRRLYLVIRGANHYRFSDAAVLQAPQVMSGLRRLGVVGLDGRRQVALTAQTIRAFFNVHLNGAPATQLRALRDDPAFQAVD